MLFLLVVSCVFEIPQVLFTFEFEFERPNGNLETKQPPNYHTFPEQPNGNLATVLLPNCHLAVQTQTQMQTEPEAYRMHCYYVKDNKPMDDGWPISRLRRTN